MGFKAEMNSVVSRHLPKNSANDRRDSVKSNAKENARKKTNSALKAETRSFDAPDAQPDESDDLGTTETSKNPKAKQPKSTPKPPGYVAQSEDPDQQLMSEIQRTTGFAKGGPVKSAKMHAQKGNFNKANKAETYGLGMADMDGAHLPADGDIEEHLGGKVKGYDSGGGVMSMLDPMGLMGGGKSGGGGGGSGLASLAPLAMMAMAKGGKVPHLAEGGAPIDSITPRGSGIKAPVGNSRYGSPPLKIEDIAAGNDYGPAGANGPSYPLSPNSAMGKIDPSQGASVGAESVGADAISEEVEKATLGALLKKYLPELAGGALGGAAAGMLPPVSANEGEPSDPSAMEHLGGIGLHKGDLSDVPLKGRPKEIGFKEKVKFAQPNDPDVQPFAKGGDVDPIEKAYYKRLHMDKSGPC